MQPYAPPRRRSGAGAIIGTILVIGFLFVGLVVAAGIAFVVLAKNETRHVRVMVERERAVSQMQQARAHADAQRARAVEPARPTMPHRPVMKTPTAEVEKEPIRVANRDITVELNQDGKITMDGKPIESDQLKSTLRDAGKGRESAVSVLIKADKKCLFEHVASVLAVCQELDIPNVRITARE